MIRERCIGKVNLEPTKMTTDGAIGPNFDRRFGGLLFLLFIDIMVYVYSIEDPMVFSSKFIRHDIL